jgi:trimeric autotransporter adhesin
MNRFQAARIGWAATAAVAMALSLAAVAGGGRADAAAVAHPAATGDIATVAGGAGGPAKATNVSLYNRGVGLTDTPCGVSYAEGRLFVADGGAAREVNPASDWLTTPAGIGAIDSSFGNGGGDGGPASAATLASACGATEDQHGNVVIADSGDNMIRLVAHRTGWFYGQHMTAGDIYDVAGNGTNSSNGNGVLATKAGLSNPQGVTVDPAGNLIIADTDNDLVRVVAGSNGTFYGKAMKAWHIYTIAGDVNSGYSGDGGPATKAELDGPYHVAVDAAGNLIIADHWNERIRVVAESTGSYYGQAMTAGGIYTIAGNGTQGDSGDGGPATSAELDGPQDVSVDGAGNPVVADTGNGLVQVIAATSGTDFGQAMTAGNIYPVAGDGPTVYSGSALPATSAELDNPHEVTVDSAGNMVIADAGTGTVRVVAHTSGTYYGVKMTAGDIYTLAGGGTAAVADGSLATSVALDYPDGAVADHQGNLVIADTGHNQIQVVAGRTGSYYGQAMTTGHIYTIAGTGFQGWGGDGGSATQGLLDEPNSVTVDSAGNVIVADTGNGRIRVIAESTGSYYGVAMTAGDIYTVAGGGESGLGDGGPATSAELLWPGGVTIDGAGNLVIADTDHNLVRVVPVKSGTYYGQKMTADDIYSVAGGGANDPGDGGPALHGTLSFPSDVAVDNVGNLVIADTFNGEIRVVAVKAGTYYGQAMKAEHIYDVAGPGYDNELGDGGPATSAFMNFPYGVAVDGPNLLIADTQNNRIQEVTG